MTKYEPLMHTHRPQALVTVNFLVPCCLRSGYLAAQSHSEKDEDRMKDKPYQSLQNFKGLGGTLLSGGIFLEISPVSLCLDSLSGAIQEQIGSVHH